MLPKEDDRAESVGERDDEWLFLVPLEVLGTVGGGADESDVFIMACLPADLSRENFIQYEVATDQVYAGLKRQDLLCQRRPKSSCLRQDVHDDGKQPLCLVCSNLAFCISFVCSSFQGAAALMWHLMGLLSKSVKRYDNLQVT